METAPGGMSVSLQGTFGTGLPVPSRTVKVIVETCSEPCMAAAPEDMTTLAGRVSRR